MLKVVHCSDIHAGRPASRELDQDRAGERRKEIETCLWRIVDVVRREEANLLIVSGDMYEHLYVKPGWAKEVAELFESISSVKVFIAPGNHDPIVKGSLYESVDWPSNVVVFKSPSFQKVLLQDIPAAIYGFGWSSFVERREVLEGFRAGHPERFSILAVHGEFPGRDGSTYLPIQPSHIEQSGLDYLALGHVHSRNEAYVGKTLAVYPGSPEPLDFGERGERGINVITVEGADKSKAPAGVSSIHSEFIAIAKREMKVVDVDISDMETPLQVRNALLDLEDASSRRRNLWAVSLTGAVDPELDLDLSGLEKELRDDFFFLRLVPAYRPAYDIEAISDPRIQSLEARFVRHMREIIQNRKSRQDDEGALVAEDALHYGLDALRQGRVVLRKGAPD